METEPKKKYRYAKYKYCRDCKHHDGHYQCLKTGLQRAGGAVDCNDRENRE